MGDQRKAWHSQDVFLPCVVLATVTLWSCCRFLDTSETGVAENCVCALAVPQTVVIFALLWNISSRI